MVFFQSDYGLCDVGFYWGLWVFYQVLCRQGFTVLVLCLYSISVMTLACRHQINIGGIGLEVVSLSGTVLRSAF